MAPKRNGIGKSSLLKRIDACKVPGFPPHITTLLVPQEVFGHDDLTPIDVVLQNHKKMKKRSAEANKIRIGELEAQLDALDVELESDQAKMEELCEQISQLEDFDGEEDEGDDIIGSVTNNLEARAREALRFFGVPESTFRMPTSKLSGGVRKKVSLACALISRPGLLLLDEPTNHLSIDGILQLRRLIMDCGDSKTTVVLVSHDVDLINDVATDTIHFTNQRLFYYPGNYRDFVRYRQQGITHELKQAGALERQRATMVKSIENLKKKSSSTSNRATKKKIGKAIESRKKKLERHGIEKNEHGHRWTAQSAGTGIRAGAINGVDASTRNGLTHKQLLKRAEVDIGPIPDKAVQFDFRDTTSTWGDEPLVMVMDVGHRYADEASNDLIFDCVELAIREGSRTTILGENGSGKSTLLSIIAGKTTPVQGTVHFATGISIGYFHQHIADELIGDSIDDTDACTSGGIVTPLSLLTKLFPHKTEHDLRSEFTNFGLSPQQTNTNIRFLSGGERCRLCMTTMMLKDPHLLVIDEISNHLDVESVEALIYGIRKWNGTLIMASHDANLIRSIGGLCYVVMEKEGKLRRIDGGIDAYLKAFTKSH